VIVFKFHCGSTNQHMAVYYNTVAVLASLTLSLRSVLEISRK